MPDVKRITADELVEKCRRQGMAFPLVVTAPITKRDERIQDNQLNAYEDSING